MTCIMKVRASSKLRQSIKCTDHTFVTGEGHFDDGSNKPSGAATPMEQPEPAASGKRKGISKKAKTAKQRLAIADGSGL